MSSPKRPISKRFETMTGWISRTLTGSHQNPATKKGTYVDFMRDAQQENKNEVTVDSYRLSSPDLKDYLRRTYSGIDLDKVRLVCVDLDMLCLLIHQFC
jgi:hypothetical protein